MITEFLFMSCVTCAVVTAAAPEKFFRNGYKYLEATQSFYKMHTLHKTWPEAKTICEQEGATFFYPQDEEEANAVISYWNSTQPFLWIYIGISTPNVKEVFETVDGLSIDIVYNKWGQGEPNGDVGGCLTFDKRGGTLNDDTCDKHWPFICKKTEASLRWNNLCDIPDPEYTFYAKTGRCYKLHLTPKNWWEAYTICNMEQSRLAVINSDEEAKILVEMVNNSPKDLIEEEYIKDAVHLGFRFNNGWKTYQGVDLRRSGYAKWGKNQPDSRGVDTCGAMFYDGLLNDISCDSKSLFICEHEVRLLQTALDYKFGEENTVRPA